MVALTLAALQLSLPAFIYLFIFLFALKVLSHLLWSWWWGIKESEAKIP